MRFPLAAAAIVAAALPLAACGGSSKKTTSSTAAKPAPLYRVGQFCVHKKERQYRAAGFTCTKKQHLARLK